MLLLSQCAPSRYVQPLAKNEHVVSAHFGGPLIGFAGTTIPIPLTTIGYGYGLTNKTTVFGNLHTTSLLYGTIQTDIGACTRLAKIKSHSMLTSNLVLNAAVSKWDGAGRIWPQIDFNYSYNFGKAKRSFVYAGVSNWFELSQKRAHQVEQERHVIINPQVGVQFAKRNRNFSLELKRIAVGIPNLPNVVDYKSVNANGGIGVYVGYSKKINFKKISSTKK